MEIDFCTVEGGAFRMGTEPSSIARHSAMFAYVFTEFPEETKDAWFRKHTPSVAAALPTFQMSRTLITRGQFREFEQSVFGATSSLTGGDLQLPVEGVSYFRARQFCLWLSRQLGAPVSLPTEPEWEYAASSRGKYLFPWGDTFDPGRANTVEYGPGHSTRAEAFAEGMSEQGILDLAGNLEEWTDGMYLPYPGGSFVHDDISEENGGAYPVLRGGCYRHHADLCLAFRRHGYRKDYTPVGFRIVKAPAVAPPTPDSSNQEKPS